MKRIISFFLVCILVFSVVCVNSSASSVQSKLESSTVTLSAVKNGVNGIRVTWQKNKYASKYRVYRKEGSEKSWTRIYDTASNDVLSFADTTVKSGKKYKYTVKGLNGSYKSLYDKSGKGITFTGAPVPSGVIASNGIKISWHKVAGAVKYRVYRKLLNDSSWTVAGNTTSTEFTDKSFTPGKDYYYTVTAFSEDGSRSSFYEKSCKIKMLKTPSVSVSNVKSGVKISWEKAGGAKEYRLYVRKASDNSWTVLKKYSADSCPFTYTDKTAKNGTRYYYTVKAFGNGTNSGWSTNTNIVKNDASFDNPLTITIDKKNPYLTVINANYRIPANYNPSLTYVCNSGERLESTVAKAYEKMYSAAAKQGIYLTPCSGYRSYDLQKRNYNNETAYFENRGYSHKESLKKAAESIMPPGASEHNLGYAMDILCVEEWFEDSPQFSWLMKHAADYGFILRYPKDKTSITKVIYEPWHWRYVGVEYAKKIKASGKCMEEYFGIF